MIKNILKEANRYDDVIDILKTITQDDQSRYPVECFAGDGGRATYDVDGKLVRQEAELLISSIESSHIDDMKFDDFENLYRYVLTIVDQQLHNYAVAISHRKVPDNDMNEIVSWEVLWNLIVCLGSNRVDDGWTIPDGWKK